MFVHTENFISMMENDDDNKKLWYFLIYVISKLKFNFKA